MTALCPGGGASQAKPGEEVLKSFTAAAILDVLVTGEMGWYGPLAAAVGYVAYNLSDLCTKDPPPMPTLSAERVWGYVNPLNPQGAAQLRQDVTDLLANYIWGQYCECVGGGAIPPFVPLPAPPGYQSNDPRLDKPPGTPCGGWGPFQNQLAFDASGNIDFTPPPTAPIPANAQWAQFHVVGGSISGPNPFPVTHTYQFRATAGGPIIQQEVYEQTEPIGAFPEFNISFPLVPGVQQLHVNHHTNTGAGSVWGTEEDYPVFCGAPPISIETPCCPPDPTLENLIIQVLRLEQLILDSLGGTFRYTKGTVHANLQGSGSLTVTGLRGVLLDVTEGTPTHPELEGVPPYEWNLGWVSLLTGDGFVDERRLTRQHQVWQPTLMPAATTVGYFLHPGVTATLTELLPSS